jgi:hypothetical protein
MTTLHQTPEIHVSTIASQNYLGVIELDDGETHLTQIATPHGDFLVSGGACNAGLLPSYARAFDTDDESLDEALQEFVADLEALPHPSGELLAWRGSMVI